MQMESDAVVKKILQNLTMGLHGYIHSVEFENDVLQAEPALSSFCRANLDSEIGKRMDNATEKWIAKFVPDSIEKEVKRHILEIAEELRGEMESIAQNVTGISKGFTTQSTSVKGALWTLTTGTFFVLSKVCLRALAGPQVALVLSGLTLFAYASVGILDTINVLEDADVAIKKSFRERMKGFSLGEVYGILEKRYKSQLYKVYDKIYKEILPNEVKLLQFSIDAVSKNVVELKMCHDDLHSIAEELQTYQRELAAIMSP
jgi:hypothetical protein